MKKAQQAALAGRAYAQLMAKMLARLAPRLAEVQHPFLVQREIKTRGILLVTTDKGLCGPLNANLFKLVAEIKTPAKYYAIGRKGSQFLARNKRDLVADFHVSDKLAFNEVKVVVELMVKAYLAGEIDTIEVIYPRFKNTLIQESQIRPVLPLASLAEFLASVQADAGAPIPTTDDREMLFEPDAADVLEALIPFYVNRHIYQLVLSARASEHSSRMVAMKTAKDNATKLLGELTLEYNKVRQGAITAELLEITTAMKAME
jgi:F-type H+-transporting ATPase subunit gamma